MLHKNRSKNHLKVHYLEIRNSVKRYFTIAPLLLIIVSFLVLGIPLSASSLEPPQKTSAVQEKGLVNEEILKGIHLLYDEQFNEAENIFQKVICESPDRPIGHFYLAMVTWSRLTSGFWSPEIVREYVRRIDRTIEVGQTRIERNSANSYDFFYLGGALGFKARFRLMKGKWLSSFFTATDAIEALKNSLRMDPANRDVLLGLGTFDYYTARLSGVLKFLSYLFFDRSSEEEGIRKLRVAASEALYSTTEAKSMLIHIYLFLEEDFLKVLPLTQDLARRYLRNPRYKLLEGVSYIRLGMDAHYRECVRYLSLKSRLETSSKNSSGWSKRTLYLESIYDLYHGRYSDGRSRLRAILNDQDPADDPSMIAWPIIKIGMSYDLEGNREEAEKHYRLVLEMENGSGAQFLAKKSLEGNPPKKDDPFIGY